MDKILITGFKHSGTTMLMNLLRAHPQVGWIEMEEGYIEYDKPKEWILMMAKKRVPNLKKEMWGEKLPWGDRDNDFNARRPISFSKKWLKIFGKKARILHILRHPIDVASSGTIDGKPANKLLNQILNSVPKYIDFVNNNLFSETVVYEDLVLNPHKHLSNIFNFLDLMTSEKILKQVINTQMKFGKINTERAFAFKKKDIKSEIDYEKILERACVRL